MAAVSVAVGCVAVVGMAAVADWELATAAAGVDDAAALDPSAVVADVAVIAALQSSR